MTAAPLFLFTFVSPPWIHGGLTFFSLANLDAPSPSFVPVVAYIADHGTSNGSSNHGTPARGLPKPPPSTDHSAGKPVTPTRTPPPPARQTPMTPTPSASAVPPSLPNRNSSGRSVPAPPTPTINDSSSSGSAPGRTVPPTPGRTSLFATPANLSRPPAPPSRKIGGGPPPPLSRTGGSSPAPPATPSRPTPGLPNRPPPQQPGRASPVPPPAANGLPSPIVTATPPNRTRPPPTAPIATLPALSGAGGRPRSGSAPQRPVTTTFKARTFHSSPSITIYPISHYESTLFSRSCSDARRYFLVWV